MKLKDILGITSYYWYGNGGHFRSAQMPLTISGKDLVNSSNQRVCTIEATSNFKLNRAFVDNWIVVGQDANDLQTNPTEQNFFYDEYFKLYKANGITNIWSATGQFDWFPKYINPSTGKEYSQRKSACFHPDYSPLDPLAWADLAMLCRAITLRYKDTGLLDYLQPLNEFDFRWNVKHVLTPEEYAVCFYECYKAIRSVSQTQKIIMGSTINPTIDTLQRFMTKLDTLSTIPIRDFYLDFHWYMRDGSSNQGGGTTGITPEDANAYEFGKQLDNFCQTNNLPGWFCTETGWATDNSKQHAPDLEGYTRAEAQGILFTRLALIWGACEYCKGITFWHSRDLYDSEPYAYAGVNNKDWSAKPGRLIVDDFLTRYGEFEVSDFYKSTQVQDMYSIVLKGQGKGLAWSNKNRNGIYTAMPAEVIIGEPTKPQVSVNITGDISKVDITVT